MGGREEEQEVRAGLRDGVYATDSPAEDPGRLREVLRRHRSRVWGLRELGRAPFLKYVPDCKCVGTPRIHPLKTTEASKRATSPLWPRSGPEGAQLGAVQSPEEDRGLDEVGDPPTPSRGIHSLRGRNDLWLASFVFRSSAAKPSLFEPAPWYRSTDW